MEKQTDICKSELDSINMARKDAGLPLITKKKRKCMRCGNTFTSYIRKAWCGPCRHHLIAMKEIPESIELVKDKYEI